MVETISKKNQIGTGKKVIIFSIAVILVLFVAAYVRFTIYLSAPLNLDGNNTTIAVGYGSSLNRVTTEMARDGVLRNPRWLRLYARLTGRTQIISGEYSLSENTTPLQLLDMLNKGEVIQYQLTLVEGRTFRDALAVMHSTDKLQKKLIGLTDQAIREKLNISESNLEGLFFPDTYQYASDVSDIDVLAHAYRKLQEVLEEEWANRDPNLPYKTPYDALIMASIVEKETGVPEERGAIAGVFVRRLQIGMKLQTDPTVIYGLGENYRGNITRKHLLQDTPYNTYTRHGLPPTPIALAGREAIHAAMHPQQGDSLFFVGMGDGHHYFSATLAEHERAVRQYQMSARKKDYRSTPINQGEKP